MEFPYATLYMYTNDNGKITKIHKQLDENGIWQNVERPSLEKKPCEKPCQKQHPEKISPEEEFISEYKKRLEKQSQEKSKSQELLNKLRLMKNNVIVAMQTKLSQTLLDDYYYISDLIRGVEAKGTAYDVDPEKLNRVIELYFF